MGFQKIPLKKLPFPNMKVENTCAYVDDDAPGALVRGTRIVKVRSDPKDGNPDGAEGYVMGSIGPNEVPGYEDRYFYWIRWDERPDLVLGIMEHKITTKETQ